MSKIDDYYLSKDYIKMIINGSVIYDYDNLIQIIYPNYNYYDNGPWSKFIKFYEFNYKSVNNSLYFHRIIENIPNSYNLINQPNLLYLLNSNNNNENKWLYLNNVFEYLTDSKVIIRIKLSNLDIQHNLDKIIWILFKQPLNHLVINDNSSERILLLEYLIERNLSLNSYYLNNINTYGY